MGLQISEFNKKLLICSLGIIILTYGICLLYKRKIVREGMPVAAMPAALMAKMSGLEAYLMSLPMKMKHHFLTMAGIRETEITVTAKGEENTAELSATVEANSAKVIAQLKAVQMKVLQAMDKVKTVLGNIMNKGFNAAANKNNTNTNKILNKVDEGIGKQKKNSVKQFMWGALKAAKDKAISAHSFAQSLALLSKIYDWALPFLQCGWYWFTNLRHCFLWYFLDTVGEILYLPFSFLIWVFPILEQPADLFWNTLDNIDCIVYDMIGYHFLHYSPAITQQCFMCNPVDFPQNLSAVGKALIKEYPIGIKDVAHLFSDSVLDSLNNDKIMAKTILGMNEDE